MRNALALSLAATLLAGCASHTIEDPNGVWINQKAIDAASKGSNLRQALLANGPILEWDINTLAKQASYSNGFELAEGQLVPLKAHQWKVDFYGDSDETLSIDGDRLVQAATDSMPQQTFQLASAKTSPETPTGTGFEHALYSAYMGGDWKITDGPGVGATVRFRPDGSIEGLPGLDRYALCLAGDCATMSGEYDSLWLEKDQQGNAFIFKRDGKRLEILQALNKASENDMPELYPGVRRWLLEQ